MPITIGHIRPVGHHHRVANRNLIAANNAHPRTHENAIANGNPAMVRLSTPDTNLYSLAGFPNRREGMTNPDVDPRNVYVPWLHDVRVGAERAAPWTKK